MGYVYRQRLLFRDVDAEQLTCHTPVPSAVLCCNLPCCAAVCFDTKAVGIGLAIYTLLIALFSGFLGPVIAGALVQAMGSFSQSMMVNGAVMVAAGLLMIGLSVWERRQARWADAEGEDHAVVGIEKCGSEASEEQGDVRRRAKDVEMA
jgi:hypothetical protein